MVRSVVLQYLEVGRFRARQAGPQVEEIFTYRVNPVRADLTEAETAVRAR